MKVWGIHFESELPAEFILTRHAEERLVERFKLLNKEKIDKIIIKAWYSKEKFKNAKVIYKNNYMYRVFNGYLFVFAKRHNKRYNYTQKALVTVYNPTIETFDLEKIKANEKFRDNRVERASSRWEEHVCEEAHSR